MHRNSQFMERLFTLIMTGAYGLVMVWMFISHYMGWNRGERSLLSLVTTWIQYTIFLGGCFLIVLFFLLLWNIKKAGDGHHHAHESDDHDCCDHDHDHDHDHHHDHADDDNHHHKHDHAEHECCDHDHDHGWNPIRYIPLLVPLILIVMGLPDTKMIENFEKYRIDSALKDRKDAVMPNEQMCAMLLGVLSVPGEVFPAVSFTTSLASGIQGMIDELDDEATGVVPVVTDLAQLDKVLLDPQLMAQYERYRKVEIDGMFSLEEVNGGLIFFRIVRLRMACCLTDSRPAMLVGVTRKKLSDYLMEKSKATGTKWVKAQGRLKFMRGQDGKYQAILKAVSIEAAKMPPFPYLN